MNYKCLKCGLSFSDKVYPIHVKRCNIAVEEDEAQGENRKLEIDLESMDNEELKAYAKEAGIKSWHVKGRDTLITELRGE